MKLQSLLPIFNQLGPEELAESWDQVGLHVGSASRQVRRALLCIDFTPSVLDEALTHRCELIVAYHPPIFEPLPRLTDADPKQRLILAAAAKKIAIYSPHTALDAARGGVNDWLIRCAGPGRFAPITPTPSASAPLKLVVFAPTDVTHHVRRAMADAGAGRQGNYSECSYEIDGSGRFRPHAEANPAIGQADRLEEVAETRIEMLVDAHLLPDVVQAMRAAHPYEEPAFDLLPRHPEPSHPHTATGAGRVGELDRPVSPRTLIARLKQHLGVKFLEAAVVPGQRRVRRLAVCPGAGGSLLQQAGPIDAYITGEMRHHDVLAAVAAGTTVLLAGHTQTERPYLRIYRDRLREAGADQVEWRISQADRPPTQTL